MLYEVLFCGISRILEVYGPCENLVCGTAFRKHVEASSTNKLIPVMFGPHLQIIYAFMASLSYPHTEWLIEAAIASKPHAVIFNTGAWDFDITARIHRDHVPAEYCDSPEVEEISKARATPQLKAIFHELGGCAKTNGVRVIYRNSHYNARYGVRCADDRFQDMLVGSAWEVWDNRNISKDVWHEQTWDGFHFDRVTLHTVEEHVLHPDHPKYTKGFGMMEIQLAQSLLHELFVDAVEHFSKQKHQERKIERI